MGLPLRPGQNKKLQVIRIKAIRQVVAGCYQPLRSEPGYGRPKFSPEASYQDNPNWSTPPSGQIGLEIRGSSWILSQVWDFQIKSWSTPTQIAQNFEIRGVDHEGGVDRWDYPDGNLWSQPRTDEKLLDSVSAFVTVHKSWIHSTILKIHLTTAKPERWSLILFPIPEHKCCIILIWLSNLPALGNFTWPDKGKDDQSWPGVVSVLVPQPHFVDSILWILIVLDLMRRSRSSLELSIRASV